MFRSFAIGVAMLIALPGLAGAQSASGQYVVTQPRHKGKVKWGDITLKRGVSPAAPKESLKLQGKVGNRQQSGSLQSKALRKKGQAAQGVMRNTK